MTVEVWRNALAIRGEACPPTPTTLLVMKTLLLLALGVVLLLIGGAITVALTVHVDRLRPWLISQLETTLGTGVRLGRLSLAWDGGVALQAEGFAVYPDRQATGEAVIQADRIRSVIRLRPLLRKELQVTAVDLVRPRLAVEGRTLPFQRITLTFTPYHGSPARSLGQSLGIPRRGIPSDSEGQGGEEGASTPKGSSPMLRLSGRGTGLTITPERLELQRGVASMAEGTAVITATVDRGTAPAETTFQVNATHVSLEALLPMDQGATRRLRGWLNGSLEGTFQGLTVAEALRTLSAQGTLRVEDVRIDQFNLLREALQRLSVLPGLMELLEQRLPATYREKLAQPHTVFEPITLRVTITDGRALLREVRLATEMTQLEGSGWISLEGEVELSSTMSIEPDLSSAMIRSVNELQALADSSGRLQFPVTLRGHLPHVTLMPDVPYVASRVVITKARELIGDFLHNALEPDLVAP